MLKAAKVAKDTIVAKAIEAKDKQDLSDNLDPNI